MPKPLFPVPRKRSGQSIVGDQCLWPSPFPYPRYYLTSLFPHWHRSGNQLNPTYTSTPQDHGFTLLAANGVSIPVFCRQSPPRSSPEISVGFRWSCRPTTNFRSRFFKTFQPPSGPQTQTTDWLTHVSKFKAAVHLHTHPSIQFGTLHQPTIFIILYLPLFPPLLGYLPSTTPPSTMISLIVSTLPDNPFTPNPVVYNPNVSKSPNRSSNTWYS